MFTGLIQSIGAVVDFKKTAQGAILFIATNFSKELDLGESVAVDGVCLTVIKAEQVRFGVEVMPETLKLTTFASLKIGNRVNLERALKVGNRLGGHFVQGHVDGVGLVEKISKNKDGWKMTITPPRSLQKYIALKGSIALNGVSLTVCKISSQTFTVACIPHTLTHTTFSSLKEGDSLNLEVDLIARYLEKLQT